MKKEHGDLPDECRRYFIIRTIIDMQIRDVVENSERLIHNAGVQSADAVRLLPSRSSQYSPERAQTEPANSGITFTGISITTAIVHSPIRRATNDEANFSISISRIRRKSAKSSHKRIQKIGLHRAVCDYIAGMTDRYVMLRNIERIFGKKTQSRLTASPLGSSASNSATVFPCPGKIRSGAISLNG